MAKKINNHLVPLYFAAAAKAYEVLTTVGIDKLPVNLEKICKHYNVKVYYYSQAIEIIELFELQRTCEANNCLCFCPDGKTSIILVNDNLDKKEQRLMIAHELGHILMDHLSLYNLLDSSGLSNYYEKEADAFAVTLIAPFPVLSALCIPYKHITSTICDIPLYVANIVHALLKNYSFNNAHEQIGKYTSKLLLSFGKFIKQRMEVDIHDKKSGMLYQGKYPGTSSRRL